jgi:hypothetical protein
VVGAKTVSTPAKDQLIATFSADGSWSLSLVVLFGFHYFTFKKTPGNRRSIISERQRAMRIRRPRQI